MNRTNLADRLRAKQAVVANRMADLGHHSPEARALQTFLRTFDGWCHGALGSSAAVVLAHRGVEDWLRFRLGKSPWDTIRFTGLVSLAVECDLLGRREAFRLRQLSRIARHARASGLGPHPIRLAAVLFWLIEFIERRW